MSDDVTRYEMVDKSRGYDAWQELERDPDGDWVSYTDYAALAARLRDAEAEVARLREACSKQNDDVCQVLGRALGYPWYKDDQTSFPGADESNGVCVGDHVAESIADEAAKTIARLREERTVTRAQYDRALDVLRDWIGLSDERRMQRIIAALGLRVEGDDTEAHDASRD